MPRIFTDLQQRELFRLLSYCDRYEINIQHWPKQTAVYISKDGVELTDFGGEFDDVIIEATKYLTRINKTK